MPMAEWKGGECSEILNDSAEGTFQKDGQQTKSASINGLACRWAGTEFERVADTSKRMETCYERGWPRRKEILEWLFNNSEAKLVEEAAYMVDGRDTLWEKEWRDQIYEEIFEDAVEIVTAILIGWFTYKGMVEQRGHGEDMIIQDSYLGNQSKKFSTGRNMKFPAWRNTVTSQPTYISKKWLLTRRNLKFPARRNNATRQPV